MGQFNLVGLWGKVTNTETDILSKTKVATTSAVVRRFK